MDTIQSYFPLLQAGAQAGTGQMMTTFVTFGLVILIFYFLIIRPQNKRQKETKKMLEALKKGDKVVSIGGIRGVVQSVKEDTVLVKVDDATKLEFNKSAISGLVDQNADDSSKKEDSKQK
ncbi:MAG: preprotein translocase subunit YajC [Spirochaetales bacterium]|nr:preprotein translocase subunit YajC [Spirochaetales bacterium]